jgi:hypothetical protein
MFDEDDESIEVTPAALTAEQINAAESARIAADTLVMCIDEQYFDGDPAALEITIVSFVDYKNNTVCRMEFYADQECDSLYSSVLRYAARMRIEKRFTGNANNHYYA